MAELWLMVNDGREWLNTGRYLPFRSSESVSKPRRRGGPSTSDKLGCSFLLVQSHSMLQSLPAWPQPHLNSACSSTASLHGTGLSEPWDSLSNDSPASEELSPNGMPVPKPEMQTVCHKKNYQAPTTMQEVLHQWWPSRANRSLLIGLLRGVFSVFPVHLVGFSILRHWPTQPSITVVT